MPTPNQLAKSGSEHGQQTALFAWVAVATHRGFAAANDDRCYTDRATAEAYGTYNGIYALKWFHAIHNQGHGDKIRGGMARAEGVKRGVFDTFLPLPRGKWAGLYIEMKVGKNNLSDEQKEFGQFVSRFYKIEVCWSWREAADAIERYFTENNSL